MTEEDDPIMEDDREPLRLSNSECTEIFDRLFPGGFAAVDVLREVAPRGWEKSPLVRVFHPTPAQIFEARTTFYDATKGIRRPGQAPMKAPSLEEATRAAKSYTKLVSPEEECAELVAMCLWDIFSDNHDVTAEDGRLVDIGSFRGAAHFLVDRLSNSSRDTWYGYMRLYMGSLGVARRADLSPVYRMIFRRMSSLDLDWVYNFPRMRLVEFGKSVEDEGTVEVYDPSEAIQNEEKEQRRAEELAKFQTELEEGYQESIKEARENDPPPIVQSYQDVYGHLPQGWPPEA